MSNELMIRKIIIISKTEESSIEVPLTKGLNIIIGKNKTGKSSLIKTIFYSLGCELKFDEDWERLNKRSIISFSIGDSFFLVERMDGLYTLFSSSADLKTVSHIGTYTYSEFSAKFLELFDINVTWITKNGDDKPVAPPYIFSFQYIDQDKGWNSIAKSFDKLSYVPNWERQIIKYIVGYQNEEYFMLRKKLEKYRILIREIELKIKTVEEFVSNILLRERQNNSILNDKNTIDDDFEKSHRILDQLTSLEKERISISNQISQLQNEEYEKKLVIGALNKYSEELVADHLFASNLEDSITCPFCGVVHPNEISEKSELIKDVQTATNILTSAIVDLEMLQREIESFQNRSTDIDFNYKKIKQELRLLEKNTNAINTLKNEGKNDLINTSRLEIEEIKNERNEYLGIKETTQNSIKGIESGTRRNNISKNIIMLMSTLLESLELKGNNVKLSNFLPVLKHTGSELPRVIYAYYISLYLYNLDRSDNPFKWLVIDTPNQQGQDDENLDNINKALELLMDLRGQVVVGTERLTGAEETAANVVRLMEYKRCLTKDNYTEHIKFLNLLDQKKEEQELEPKRE
ncbi:hypothetical protein [Paenibacillus monticola]|uniref:Rad50/SbcC-type AAA domain-containing protein n=1 Tax=Paenibacillus monticola TaxID=2666075 RepID=A0A7X2H8V2_9BACL|nr:hypothetical protein [Paenibacillus monticola]MRN55590.1 hypothetical protein [Paenibacillus monticola]